MGEFKAGMWSWGRFSAVNHSLALETFSSSVCLEPEGLESQKRWRLVWQQQAEVLLGISLIKPLPGQATVLTLVLPGLRIAVFHGISTPWGGVMLICKELRAFAANLMCEITWVLFLASTSFLHLKIWQKNHMVKIRFIVVSSQNPDYSDVIFTMCVDRLVRFFWEKKWLHSPPAVCNLFVWCSVVWSFVLISKNMTLPHKAKTTHRRGRESTYSVIRGVVPRGHFEHVSAISASLSWDVAALSLIQSWETDRPAEGECEGRMKEDLEQKLLCWEGIADRGGCVCSASVFHELSTGVMKGPAWISALLFESQKSVLLLFREKVQKQSIIFCNILGIGDCPWTCLVIENAGQMVSWIWHL